ncbi:hypothetical protein KQH40_00860 [bacterium]|nr:hypothetical protein [bacterium]
MNATIITAVSIGLVLFLVTAVRDMMCLYLAWRHSAHMKKFAQEEERLQMINYM